MFLQITDRYLWFPVDENAPLVRLHLFYGNEKIDEIHIHLSNGQGIYYACKDMKDYVGSEIEIIRYDERPADMIFCMDHKPENIYRFRPKIHFSPDTGYLLDPNGLIYADDYYHLYHQYNPYGTEWNNMHWGHGRSKDLLHWEERDIFMYPDGFGPCFSGSAIRDYQNLLGYGSDALIYFYTAAGGKSEWSREKGFSCRQKMKISTDGGETCFDDDRFCMEQMVPLNRDPQVFYHEESKAYIMVLFLIGHQFRIFRSTDLLHWEETQTLEFPGTWECPNLFPLLIGKESKWVFWTVQGYYILGSFNGYHFTAETSILQGFSAKGLHAMQIFSETEGRTIGISCITGLNNCGHYRGIMSIPCELSLVQTWAGPRVSFAPIRELTAHAEWKDLLTDGIVTKLPLGGKTCFLHFHYEDPQRGCTTLELGNLKFEFDFCTEKIIVTDLSNMEILLKRTLSCMLSSLDFYLLIDQEIVELFCDDGIIYAAFGTVENILGSTLVMKSEIPVTQIRILNPGDVVSGS